MSSRSTRLVGHALKDSKYVMLRGLPRTATSRDVRRAIMQAGIKGVADVDLQYKHFRPTGKALLTMSLPDYTHDAVLRSKRIAISDCNIEAELVRDLVAVMQTRKDTSPGWDSYVNAAGDGPSAGVVVGSTVSLCGTPGKTTTEAIQRLCQGFRLAKLKKTAPVQRVPLPPNTFAMPSRFCIHLVSESEAQKFVRTFHMTPYKGVEGGPILTAEIIY